MLSEEPTFRLGSIWKDRNSNGLLIVGLIGSTAFGRAGIGTVLPSTPIRNAFVGSVLGLPWHTPAVLGARQVVVRPKPTPRIGIITMPTPLSRSNERA